MAKLRKVGIVIPTRNRAELAENAIRSVLEQPNCDIVVLVSDNSTIGSEVERLKKFCSKLDDTRVQYLRPHTPLGMCDHWEWALGQGMALQAVSHFIYLTDRMIFKNRSLSELLQIASRYPTSVISYNHDRIDDYEKPIRLEQYAWTGLPLKLNSCDLLAGASSVAWHFWVSLPRMLNCIVPRDVISTISARFGNVFLSIAPDFCFGYRCLEMVDAIIYYDKPLLVHYAQDRSNGASQFRGIPSKDHEDFLANLGGKKLNYASPLPAFNTVMNAMIHEYCFVKGQASSSKFQEVNRVHYLEYLAFEIAQMPESAMKREMNALLWKHDPGIANGAGTLRHFSPFPKPEVREFDEVRLALEFAKSHSRARRWKQSYEESNMPARILPTLHAALTMCPRLLLMQWSYCRDLPKSTRRLMNKYVLWRFSRMSGTQLKNHPNNHVYPSEGE